MPATPRDREKPRQERLAEVMYSAQLQAGQANAQQIISGLELEAETKKFKVLAGEYAKDGVSELVKTKAITGQSVPAGAKTSAGQKCYVLVEINEKEEVFTTVSAITTGAPILPALTASTAGRIAVGVIEVPEEFTPGTTEVKASMLKAIVYSAGNKKPNEGF